MQTLHGSEYELSFFLQMFSNCHLIWSLKPERIDPKNFARGYDVRSDVWSLGITLVTDKF